MNRRTVTLTLALLAVVAGGAVYWWTARADAPAEPAPAMTDPETAVAQQTSAEPPTAPPLEAFEAVSADDDPIGPLRLEGIVLGVDEQPVAGATVFLDSRPPRTQTAGEDGTFAFDNLPGRTYRVTARDEGLVGGPVVHRLSDASDPVVIRVREGARLEVAVVSQSTGEALAGASVQLRGDADDAQVAGDDGIATFRGVSAGGHVVVAEAPGYARAQTFVQVPESASTALRARLELAAGAPVTGRVVDPDGNPVAGARVVARDAGDAFAAIDPKRDGAVTDDKGQFRLPAVGAGNYRFVAYHTEHPPASTEAIELDGTSERTGVVIVAELGGILAGRAIDDTGAPVPWATVRVGPDPREQGVNVPDREGARQAVAGEDGSFRIQGLPRAHLVATASSETATSDFVGVDLHNQRGRRDVTLTLDITGAIAGVVVNDAGEPVAEAQVVAYPDVLEGESLSDLMHRGPGYATSDGGGRFRIGGLRDGAYRLYATREDARADNARTEPAKTGDDDVRLVLPAPGGVAGRVAFRDGSQPSFASVSVGMSAGVPVDGDDGAFRVDGVAPGTYDLIVRGPEFPEHIERDVRIEPGEVVDVGTIELPKGRAVVGRVVDASGRAVAGAAVVAGKQLLGDGKNLTANIGTQLDDQMGLRRATAGPDGRFRIRGIGPDQLVVAAEHPERGRAHAQPIPAGTEDATVELRLAPFGGLRGTVTLDGEPAASAMVMVTSATSAYASVMAPVGNDGAFVVERLASGPYKVTAMVGAGMSSTMTSKQVRVPAGTAAEVALALVTGDVTLKFTVAPVEGAHIDAAQVFLFEGEVDVKTGEQLIELFSGAAASGAAKMAFAWGDKPAEFKKLVPGPYSGCIIPITGDMNDVTFAQRLQRNVGSLAVYCRPLTVADSPEEQSHREEVPAMSPLPEE